MDEEEGRGVLCLTDEGIQSLIGIDEAVECLRHQFSAATLQETTNHVRSRIHQDGSSLHVMSAGVEELHAFGTKVYTTGDHERWYRLLLFDSRNGRLLAVMEAGSLGQIRTGAATGLATDLLARRNAKVLGVIGAGRHMWWQVAAIAAVRELEEVRVYTRTSKNRDELAARITRELNIPARGVSDPRTTVSGADIVTVLTPSQEPVFFGEWLEPGMHVNAAGANDLRRRELDEHTMNRAGLVVVDDFQVAIAECGDLYHHDVTQRPEPRSLAELVSGDVRRESEDMVTVFESQGVAVQDVALASLALTRISGGERS